MPLSLYRRHQGGCEAQLPLEEKTGEFEERKRGGNVPGASFLRQEPCRANSSGGTKARSIATKPRL
jgi:hypothetical protein